MAWDPASARIARRLRTGPRAIKERKNEELGQEPAIWPQGPDPWPVLWRAGCFLKRTVNQQKPIEVRHLRAGGRLIPVQFFRNAGGSVAGRFVLGAEDTPIVAHSDSAPSPSKEIA